MPGGLFCAIGNPLNDGTWQYSWVNGRQLARMQSVDIDASFVYNENGLRVQKTVNGVVTNYTLYTKYIVHMTCGTDELHFFYDAQNKPAVVVYNDTPYSYVKNLQGDVVALLDSTGVVVVKYVYDAWGRPISKTGSLASTLGTVQPFRYRGYVYDEETGLYYLRSRYYNSEWLRFVNADMLLQQNFNLFGYCMQNPSNRVDPDGEAYFSYADWDMLSNRSFTSPLNLGSIAGGYQGNTADIRSDYNVWKRAQAYEEAWINSPYNNELINATSDPNKPDNPKYQPNAKGYYGEKGKNSRVLIGSVDDARVFFEAITYGNYVFFRPTSYDGTNRYMIPYGNVIFRPDSKSGTPVIEFNDYPPIPNQKIHFEE